MSLPEIVLIADERVLAIPIIENLEPLIDVAKRSTPLLFEPIPEVATNLGYTQVRSSVFERLEAAQQLLPSHLKLCLYEGLRSLSVQKYLFDERRKIVLSLNPQGSDLEIFRETIRLISPVQTLDGVQNIPPHSTGGAVDVYLTDASTHQPVEMGILCKDWMSDNVGVSRTDTDLISTEARKNRRILATAMSQAGFVNYPTEYWHWSYGDRYWAFVTQSANAIYGAIDG